MKFVCFESQIENNSADAWDIQLNTAYLWDILLEVSLDAIALVKTFFSQWQVGQVALMESEHVLAILGSSLC